MLRIRVCAQRRDSGFAHIPEDRLIMGLNLQTNLDENVVVTSYQRPPYSQRGVFQLWAIFAISPRKSWIDFRSNPRAWANRSARCRVAICKRSCLGRELEGDPKLIVANQPTRGLDVGSIEFVHKTLIEQRDRGAAVLLISVELDEILALSDRIAVMFEGKILAVLDAADATEEKIGLLMAGGSLEPAAEKAQA